MRQDAFTAYCASAAAGTAEPPLDIGRRRVAAVTEPVGHVAGRACDNPGRFEPGEPPGHHIAGLVVPRPVAELRRPGFVVPGDHRPVAIHANTLVNDVGLPVVL